MVAVAHDIRDVRVLDELRLCGIDYDVRDVQVLWVVHALHVVLILPLPQSAIFVRNESESGT